MQNKRQVSMIDKTQINHQRQFVDLELWKNQPKRNQKRALHMFLLYNKFGLNMINNNCSYTSETKFLY